MPEELNIVPGSVWADNAPRQNGRTVRVTEADERYVYVTVVTNSRRVQEDLDTGNLKRRRDTRGHAHRVLRVAFSARRRRTGYRPTDESADA
ncbi:hypothetical protein [Actinomadura litoris]|uniref:hypothetical protein n=1 Tax=Actinomadura litoris TaxID=2678616 RepID=UPI001FA741A2|nr:hypothetical protein [Actinomadura litoris]